MSADARPPRRRPLAPALVLALVLVACTGQGDAAVEVPETGADLTVVGTDTLRWVPEALEADAGEISLSLTCQEGVGHNIVVEQVGEIAACAPGRTVEATVELAAGDYEYVCTVPGHQRSMRGQLTVG